MKDEEWEFLFTGSRYINTFWSVFAGVDLMGAGGVRYDTHDLWEGQAGLSFTLSKDVSLLARWHSTFGFGGGLEVRF